jgi:hypothetical protein
MRRADRTDFVQDSETEKKKKKKRRPRSKTAAEPKRKKAVVTRAYGMWQFQSTPNTRGTSSRFAASLSSSDRTVLTSAAFHFLSLHRIRLPCITTADHPQQQRKLYSYLERTVFYLAIGILVLSVFLNLFVPNRLRSDFVESTNLR